MSIRRAREPWSAPFAPARGLDAVLRVGAAAAKAKEEEKDWAAFFKTADEKLNVKSNELNELRIAITKLRLALQRSRDETEGEVTVLQNAIVDCVSRKGELEKKLEARAKLNRKAPAYVAYEQPYEQPAYAPYAGSAPRT
tara:strand:- start:1598 stop:2017 length:420 start_codon:yes stop_codon:yes gene_type:complete